MKVSLSSPRAPYEPPRAEIHEIEVERGFAASGDYDDFDTNEGTEKPGRDDISDPWYIG